MNNKVLILAAHPDDEVLGCGGTIRKYKEENSKVFVCFVTDGSSTQYAYNPKLIRQKEKECELANKILGVDEIIKLNLPDMKLDTIPHFKLNQKLEKVIDEIKPNILYTHSSTDINKDHFLINLSTLITIRPGKLYLEKVYEYEVLSSTEWQRNSAFIPNSFVDITRFIDLKIKSFTKYKTEIREYPHPRSPQGIRTLAKYRGIQSGYKYAEAFKLLLEYK